MPPRGVAHLQRARGSAFRLLLVIRRFRGCARRLACRPRFPLLIRPLRLWLVGWQGTRLETVILPFASEPASHVEQQASEASRSGSGFGFLFQPDTVCRVRLDLIARHCNCHAKPATAAIWDRLSASKSHASLLSSG
ncbi:hypothetical protein N656DRAFT_780778 [Canariomyces notabilis]|uniref:Uncharacterized protein n=1 Tax=Canariomyces notabilis TaxID=2074819 RepID=A0AAN6TBT7_9PEZI|nr:hypothetical protein N656DRAFT_780778 [Canariomyces arenarius]